MLADRMLPGWGHKAHCSPGMLCQMLVAASGKPGGEPGCAAHHCLTAHQLLAGAVAPPVGMAGQQQHKSIAVDPARRRAILRVQGLGCRFIFRVWGTTLSGQATHCCGVFCAPLQSVTRHAIQYMPAKLRS